VKIYRIALMGILAGLVLAAVGTARAETDINMWGCSAEFFLWSTMNSGTATPTTSGTPNFLGDSVANGGMACTSVTYAFDSALTNVFWAQGSGCRTDIGDGTGIVNIKIGYKTSNDAIWSIMGEADPEAVAAGTQCNSTIGTGVTTYMRPLPSGTAPPSGNTLPYPITPTTSSCQTITMGMSDEGAAYFTQTSFGNQYGACLKSGSSCSSANNVICRTFGPSGTYCIDGGTPAEPVPSAAGLAYYNPIADPTAFYVNKAVTEGVCSGGTTPGDMCGSSSDCGTGGTCNVATLTNISRMMAAQIFTGSVSNWNDFGGGFPNLPIWACMRHTGAGTNITFDYAVMGDSHNWLPSGYTSMLNTDAIQSGVSPSGTGALLGPWVYFYDTIGSQLNCVNGIVDNTSAANGFSAIGAIGYTDADRSTSLASHTAMVNYNNVIPSRRNVRNGLYDFWSKNYIYYNPTTYPTSNPTYKVFNAMMEYGTNLTNFNRIGAKSNFWATMTEMHYIKNGADILPGPYQAASTPQSP
jgi:hypothetical protein